MNISEMANLISKIHAGNKYYFDNYLRIYKRFLFIFLIPISLYHDYFLISKFRGSNLDQLVIERILELTRIALKGLN